MGPSKVQDLELEDGTIGKDQLVVVENASFSSPQGVYEPVFTHVKYPPRTFSRKTWAYL